MENLRIKYKRVVLTIPTGQNVSAEKDILLPQGVATAIATLNPNKANEPNEFVDLQITENGSQVIEPMDYRYSERTTHGRHLDSWKQVNFQCGRTVQAKITSTGNLTADLKIQLVIAIILPN